MFEVIGKIICDQIYTYYIIKYKYFDNLNDVILAQKQYFLNHSVT